MERAGPAPAPALGSAAECRAPGGGRHQPVRRALAPYVTGGRRREAAPGSGDEVPAGEADGGVAGHFAVVRSIHARWAVRSV